MASALAGVEGVYVMVDQHGEVFFIDGHHGGKASAGKLEGKSTAPFSVACTVDGGGETCVIADAEGNCWYGPARATGQTFKRA